MWCPHGEDAPRFEIISGAKVFPNRGSPHSALEPGLRSVAFERRATIYYRVAGATDEIVRILHAGRDAGRGFGGG